MTLLGFVDFSEGYDVRVVQNFKNLGFFQGFFLFPFTHPCDVDLLDDAQVSVRLALNKESFTKGTFAE